MADITLDPWQQEFLSTEGDKILCTGRQVGKSVICSKDAGEYAVKNPKQNILMIAPTERQAFALFEKTLDYIVVNHRYKILRGKDRPTKTRIKLNNGTTIFCLPTGLSGIGIRFMTVHRLYVDEASRVPNDVWSAVTPMLLTTGGSAIFLSTPAGKQGYFYDCWINEDNAFSSFKRFSISSEKVIRERAICDTWTEFQRERALLHLERERKRMTALEYSQEYMGEFVDELTQYFPTELVKKCLVLDREGAQHFSQLPYKTYAGVDVARMGDDKSVIVSVGINHKKVFQFDMETTTKTYLTETTRRILAADSRYKYRKIYIDDGGMGVGVFDPLLEHPQTKRKVVPINNAQRSLDREDGRKKKLLKEDLYANLRLLMEQGRIRLLADDDLYHSLRSVQAEYSGEQLRIFGNDTHATEALIRAAWAVKDKNLNSFVRFF